MSQPPFEPDRFLRQIGDEATTSGAFESISLDGTTLRCKAKGSAADAWYIVTNESGTGAAARSTWYVQLVTPDRWLSESIETDLMHYGDPIEELVEEELVELGHDAAADGAMPVVKHFRSDARLYTFESPLPLDAAAGDGDRAVRIASRFLLAYEAAFRRLGDMSADGSDE